MRQGGVDLRRKEPRFARLPPSQIVPRLADEGRYLVCSALIACHTLWYDNTNTDCGYTFSRE